MEKAKDLLSVIVKAMVDFPEQVTINTLETGTTIILELHVVKEDRGKVIGREGRNAHAIRAILQAYAGKEGRRCHLEIVEDG